MTRTPVWALDAVTQVRQTAARNLRHARVAYVEALRAEALAAEAFLALADLSESQRTEARARLDGAREALNGTEGP